ncbi:TrmH family RNA methyltransferase [Acidihalobacter ferrooxydans]|uniref:tRNA/rRNA methyltransferase SpoU type domain-containing protein n=1 Tax=Acidihalobacter ferrooxydans TaxID=1765967 RepID=A0A1P8UIC0_9GAMM|nr:TrmH family RNA methyltransferase [Acidihalobacter ferrooxydans]APZ43567.1 hypothetical protein BW247_11095 [Acidihalobacter ferrooxydans]
MRNRQLNHDAHRGALKKHSVCLLANDIGHATNVGSLFRIADALGVEHIFLTGSTPRPPHPKIRKTSRATEKHVPYSHASRAVDAVAALKTQGYRIISLELTSCSIDIDKLHVVPGEKICLILGEENAGVAQELLDLSDDTVHIPMLGIQSSMNVAVACAIATHAITRRMASAAPP